MGTVSVGPPGAVDDSGLDVFVPGVGAREGADDTHSESVAHTNCLVDSGENKGRDFNRKRESVDAYTEKSLVPGEVPLQDVWVGVSGLRLAGCIIIGHGGDEE